MKLLVDTFGHFKFEPTNQDLIKVPKAFRSTNKCKSEISEHNIFYNIYDTKTITNVKNQLLMDKNYESEYVFV